MNKPSLITNLSKRKVTLSKRKRGLFKKAIELSELCGIEVFLVVFDPEKQKLYELNSQPEFDIDVIGHMLDKVNKQQFMCKHYTNDDFKFFQLEKDDQSNDKISDVDSNSPEDETQPKQGHDQKTLNKRDRKCYKKEQQMIIQQLQDEQYYEESNNLEERLAKFIKPENQGGKYKERYEVARQKMKKPSKFKLQRVNKNLQDLAKPIYNTVQLDNFQIQDTSNNILPNDYKNQIEIDPPHINLQSNPRNLNRTKQVSRSRSDEIHVDMPMLYKQESGRRKSQEYQIPSDCFLESSNKFENSAQKDQISLLANNFGPLLNSPINRFKSHNMVEPNFLERQYPNFDDLVKQTSYSFDHLKDLKDIDDLSENNILNFFDKKQVEHANKKQK